MGAFSEQEGHPHADLVEFGCAGNPTEFARQAEMLEGLYADAWGDHHAENTPIRGNPVRGVVVRPGDSDGCSDKGFQSILERSVFCCKGCR